MNKAIKKKATVLIALLIAAVAVFLIVWSIFGITAILPFVLAIATMYLVVAIEYATSDGERQQENDKEDLLQDFSNRVGPSAWLEAIISGVIVFAVTYLVPKLEYGWFSQALAAVALVGAVGLTVCLIIRWLDPKKGGATVLELGLFSALAIVFWWATHDAAKVVTGVWNNKVFGSVVMTIPWLALVSAIGTFVTDFFYFRHKATKKKDTYWQLFGRLAFIFSVILLGWLLIRGVSGANFTEPAREVKAGEPAGAGKSTGGDIATKPLSEEEIKLADDRVKEIVITPSNVDQNDIDKFYAKYGRKLMTNTWPSNARDRKDNTAFLLDGKGLYGAVEFPVDVAFCRSADYDMAHEGSYTDKELEAILYWIEDRLKSGELSDAEKTALTDWVVVRIARDPVYGHMWAQAFSELHSYSGKTVREMFPDYDQFLTDWEEGKRLEYYSCTHDNGDERFISPEYEPYGYAVAATFESWTAVCLGKPTAYHFRMEDVKTIPSKMTTVKAPGMESLAAVIFAAYEKDQDVFKERIALNVYDGRAEIIPEPEKDPEPTTPPPTTPVPTTPVPTTPVPTTPVPTTPVPTTPVPTTPVPTTPAPTKDPSKGLTDPADVGPGTDETGPGTYNTESSLTPPSTKWAQPTQPATTEAPTVPETRAAYEETTEVPTSADSRESEAESSASVEPPVNATEPDVPTTGPITTIPGTSWGGPSD